VIRRDRHTPAFPAEIERRQPCDGVLVLRMDLAHPTLDEAWAREILSPEEARRADGYLQPEDRARARASRALTRTVLAAWTASAPGDLDFETGAHGKPRLKGGGPLFSISHSVDRLLVAVSDGPDVGVDVEMRRTSRDFDAAARFVFGAEDLEAIDPLEDDVRVRAILRVWTAKEAALKAIGAGLQRPMRDVALGEALATIGIEAWEPGVALVGDRAIALHDISAADDIACLAVLARPPRKKRAR
jgi:4'-phosphopantetheinyl transferase